MSMIEQYRRQIATLSLCEALDIPRASSFYRQQARKASTAPVATRQRPDHALTEAEQQAVLATLNDPCFMDLAPPPVYAQLLEEGRYLCSIPITDVPKSAIASMPADPSWSVNLS